MIALPRAYIHRMNNELKINNKKRVPQKKSMQVWKDTRVNENRILIFGWTVPLNILPFEICPSQRWKTS